MIRIAIVDDEITIAKLIETKIEKILQKLNDSCEIKLFPNGYDFMNVHQEFDFDLLCLDIDMPEISGFDIADIIRSVKPKISIIFISNMENLVFKSLEFRPFRFVRKSCLEDDLYSAIKAFQKELKDSKDTFTFKTSDAERHVYTSDIVYFESMRHDIFVQTIDEKYKMKRERETYINMNSISDLFAPKGFIRVHKSYLVNYKHIYVINRDEVILKNTYEIHINSRNFNDIKNIYQKIMLMGG